MKYLSFIKFSAFFLWIVLMVYYGLRQPKIFILHSYNTDYSWVEQVNQPIQKKLSLHPSYHVRWHYMDTKNHPDFSFRQRAGVWARHQIDDFRPDILLAIDDDAQAFVSKFYVDTPGIKIVYTAVNGEGGDYGFELAQNATGVFERLPLQATKEFIQILAAAMSVPSVKIIHIGDTSSTVKADEKTIFNFDWAPLYLIDSILVETFEEWKKAIQEAQVRADFIYITNYRKLYKKKGSPQYALPKTVMEWTVANSKIPIIGGNSFVVEDGASMAIATSPFEQGRLAIEMVKSLLDGTPLQDIPPRKSEEFLVVLRDQSPFKIPAVYRSFAQGMDRLIENK